MFVAKFFWHDASKELPNKSCDVVVACGDEEEIYGVYNVRFSSRCKMFNCGDCNESPETAFSDVKYWMYFDELANTLKAIEKIN